MLNVFRAVSSVVVMLSLFLLSGCPKGTGAVAEDPNAGWRKVDAGSIGRPQVDEKLQEKFRQEKAKREVEKMRAVFLIDGETTCKKDQDCTTIPYHCCACEQGGKMVGVSRTSLPTVVQRRVALCDKATCPNIVSDDPSCGGTVECQKGKCVVVPAAPAPKGLGEETIPDDAKVAPEKKPGQ